MRRSWSTASALAEPTTGRGRRSVPDASIQAPASSVGASIWQTPGGVQDELGRIHEDFEAFARDVDGVIQKLGPRPYADDKRQALADFYDHVWLPKLAAWRAWYQENNGWWGNLWWNHAPTAEQYSQDLVQIRDQAKRLGMEVLSPAPHVFGPSALFDPEHNIVDDAARGAGDVLKDSGSLIKIAGIGIAAIGGIVLLQAISRH